MQCNVTLQKWLRTTYGTGAFRSTHLASTLGKRLKEWLQNLLIPSFPYT